MEEVLRGQPIRVIGCVVSAHAHAQVLAERLRRIWNSADASGLGWVDGESPKELAAAMASAQSTASIPVSCIDAVFVVGGDGFLMETYHAFDGTGLRPLLIGWNAGHVGFLMNDAPHADDALQVQLANFRNGVYTTELAYPVCAQVQLRDGTERTIRAFNEITLRASGRQAVRLHRWINGADLGVFGGGGFIVATPQGSTAFAGDAGGPLVDPAVPSLVLVPMTTHRARIFAQLHNALVLSPHSSIRVDVLERDKRPIAVETETEQITDVDRVLITSAYRHGPSQAIALGYAYAPDGRRFPARVAKKFIGRIRERH